MSISARDIIAKKTEHVFTDNNTKDIKFSRDCLVMIADVNGQSYYLTLSTHNNNAFEYYQKNSRQCYLLTKKKCEGLAYTSCVNLDEIYEEEPLGKLVVIVPMDEYALLIEKFKKWQSKKPHRYYEKIKNYI